MADDGGRRVLDGADDAGGHGVAAQVELRMDRGDHEIELGEQVVVVVERAVAEDIRLNALEDVEGGQFLVEPVDFLPLALDFLNAEPSGVGRGLAVVGNAHVLKAAFLHGAGHGL